MHGVAYHFCRHCTCRYLVSPLQSHGATRGSWIEKFHRRNKKRLASYRCGKVYELCIAKYKKKEDQHFPSWYARHSEDLSHTDAFYFYFSHLCSVMCFIAHITDELLSISYTQLGLCTWETDTRPLSWTSLCLCERERERGWVGVRERECVVCVGVSAGVWGKT